MFNFFKELMKNVEEVRDNRIYLTHADLAAEQQYNASTHEVLDGNNPHLVEFKAREFSQGTHFDTPNLTPNEQDVLCRIGPNGVTGQQLVDLYISTYEELKQGFAMGMAWIADNLTNIENIMSRFPEILDSLVEKGAVVEQTKLEATSTLSM